MKPQIIAELVKYKSRMVPFYAWQANRGQGAGVLCDLFNDDGGN